MKSCGNCKTGQPVKKRGAGRNEKVQGQGGNFTIAIAGNPNCGKTTLFNALTGGDQRVGNWPGVTVERVEGTLSLGSRKGNLIDLPGIYTLVPDSEDERVARTFLACEHYDLVINVVDASNLERNLFLTMQLAELGVPMILAVNKCDLASKNGIKIDADKLSGKLGGIQVYTISANNPEDAVGMARQLEKVITDPYSHIPGPVISYPGEIDTFLADAAVPERVTFSGASLGGRGIAISYLEKDDIIISALEDYDRFLLDRLAAAKGKLIARTGEDIDILIAKARYAAITNIDTCILQGREKGGRKRFSIDSLVLHKVWGVPIFFAVMFLVFMVTMSVGGAFIDFFDIFFGAVFVSGTGWFLTLLHAPDWLVTFLAGGVGGSIQTISTFIPVIFCMFLMLGILEESGYMARAAFVMDKFMRVIGLPGKAFVPLLVGFGCSVPAIMATRTLENRRDRFLTIFMIPFMSCGARLPVYALFAAVFFSSHTGVAVFSIYLSGIILALCTGLVMKNTLFTGSFSPFIIEIPSYTIPSPGKAVRYAGTQLKFFIVRAGKVILIAVVILTLLGSLGTDGSFGNDNTENSVLSVIGKNITPVFNPMGISNENWPATVGLFTGIFAKETIIGTLNSLYAGSAALEQETAAGNEEPVRLGDIAREAWSAFTVLGQNLVSLGTAVIDPLNLGIVSSDEETVSEAVEAGSSTFAGLRENFTPASAYAYMLFVLIYFPCVAALGAAFREAGVFYGSILSVYLTVLAWIVSVLFYQIAEGHSLAWAGTAAGAFVLLFASLKVIGYREKGKKIQAGAYL